MTNHLDVNRFKKCSCGEDVQSPLTQDNYYYSLMGWFWWTMGTTAIPKKIEFTCKKCDKKFETITNKDLIKYYIFYKKN